jgi:hypothetical protein
MKQVYFQLIPGAINQEKYAVYGTVEENFFEQRYESMRIFFEFFRNIEFQENAGCSFSVPGIRE